MNTYIRRESFVRAIRFTENNVNEIIYILKENYPNSVIMVEADKNPITKLNVSYGEIKIGQWIIIIMGPDGKPYLNVLDNEEFLNLYIEASVVVKE